MLTLKQIKENTEAVIERLRKKQFEAREAINEVLNFDEIRRRSQQELDACSLAPCFIRSPISLARAF